MFKEIWKKNTIFGKQSKPDIRFPTRFNRDIRVTILGTRKSGYPDIRIRVNLVPGFEHPNFKDCLGAIIFSIKYPMIPTVKSNFKSRFSY